MTAWTSLFPRSWHQIQPTPSAKLARFSPCWTTITKCFDQLFYPSEHLEQQPQPISKPASLRHHPTAFFSHSQIKPEASQLPCPREPAVLPQMAISPRPKRHHPVSTDSGQTFPYADNNKNSPRQTEAPTLCRLGSLLPRPRSAPRRLYYSLQWCVPRSAFSARGL